MHSPLPHAIRCFLALAFALLVVIPAALADNLLTGSIIGTSGTFGSGNTKEKAMDGDTTTFFDGPTANGDWVGLDMTGQLPKLVTAVRFFPRATFAGRMTGGVFQGANLSDFSDAVALATIASTPPQGVYTSLPVSVTNAFSYVRYLAPNNGWGNVAEIEFYGLDLANAGAPNAPTNLVATAGDGQVILKWGVTIGASSYKVKRAASNAIGPFTVIASGLTATNYTDTNVVNGTLYYYRVAGNNANGDGPDSASATAVPQTVQTFGLYRQLWTGLSATPGNTLAALTNVTYNPGWPDSPNAAYTRVFTNFEAESGTGLTRYGQRLRGFVVPPTNGAYTFWISSDDSSALLLSPDENATNAGWIASVSTFSNFREWTKQASQQSVPITLESGRRYYIEAEMQQGTGGDNLSVRWQMPGGVFEEPMTAFSAAGTRIVPCTGVDSLPGIFQQPTNVSVVEGLNAVFAVLTTNQSTVAYQWQLGSANLSDPNAFKAAYTVSNASLALNNGQVYRCVITNSAGAITSAPITLHVLPDTLPPTVVQAFNNGLSNVLVVFSEPIQAATATNLANFVFTNGLAITGGSLGADNRTLTLSTAPLTYNSNYSIVINGVKDRAAVPNTIATNTLVSFLASPYVSQDIGNPAPSVTTILTNGLNVTASGTDIGGFSDQLSLNYQLRSGNFDVAVRVAGLTPADVWAKAGLMARETLDAGSRFAAAFATPAMNGSFLEYRNPASSVAISMGNFPVNYPNTWLRLQRVGDIFTAFAGYDGQTWTQLGSATISMSSPVYLGFAVSSHNAGQATTAQFRDFTDVTSALLGPVVNPHEPPGPSSRKTPIAITEIMYKPAPRTDGRNLEYLEIYNSNPWFNDISGYRLVAGNLTFAFPTGTLIPGGAYSVVAAVPADIQAVYGITNVMGPYSGSLTKSDSVQLLDEQGAVLLEIPYANQPPWPIAADGAGHSLVAANPTYGEADPRAWDISDVVGGSPGQMDAFRPSPLRNIVINEFLAHTDPPDYDYVELYNHSSQAIDISGCILTDDAATNKFVIPPGTVIPARGFVYYSETNMNFALSALGETIFLKNPSQTRILDAVQFDAQENGVATGRWPDGADQFYRLTTRTPGAANAPIRLSNVVINELMYDPISGNDDDQYVELYNRSLSSVNLGGWTLSDAINFTFASNVVLQPDSYLVVAANAARLRSNYANLNLTNCLGDFSGKFSHNGEHFALTMPDTSITTNGQGVVTTNLLHITVNDVTYNSGGRWGQWAAGGGSSLELINPNANTRLAANWADSDETAKSAWVNIEITAVLDNGANFDAYIDYAQFGLLDIGECLVDNLEVRAGTSGTNLVANSDFESGLANWSFQGDFVRSSLENTGYVSAHSLHVRCSDRIWTGDNSCQMALFTNTLASGQTATMRFKARWLRGWPEALLRLNGNWLEATGRLPVPPNLGTPGARNSQYVTNAGPAIYAVTHTPSLPAAGQAAVVTARIHDSDGVQSLTLNYRLDPAQIYTSVPMTDDGANGDALAGDGLFSATIPGQAANTVVAFYLSATDSNGATARFPALLNDISPTRECLVMFGDGNAGGSFAVYHLWITQSNATRWAQLSDLSNESHDCTFVHGNRVVYNVQARFAGSPYHQGFDTPYGSLCHYKWTFPDDDKFLGATSFNKIHQPGNGAGDDSSLQREQTSNLLLRTLGVPWLYRRCVAVYVNGNRRGTLMEDAQTPDGDFVKEHYPKDKDGWLYKMQPWFEFAPFPGSSSTAFANESWCELMPHTTTGGAKKAARYRYMFEVRRTPTSANDFTNVYSLVDAASSFGKPNYVASMLNLADMENWMRVFAANHAAANRDAYGATTAQNLYGYIGTQDTRYSLLMFDFNICLDHGAWSPGANLFLVNPADTNTARLFVEPTFRRMYWRALQELVNGSLDMANSGPLIDAKYNAFIASGLNVESPAAMKNWMTQARASIATQIAAENAPSFTVNPGVTISNGVAYVTGTAPVNVATIWLNGAAFPVTWTSVSNWLVAVGLQHGTNQFNAAGIDIHGQPIPGDTNSFTVVYNGNVPAAPGLVVINEIMYSPFVPEAGYVELYNTSSNLLFDLSGWEFHGLSYTFPPGSLLAPNSFLTLAANGPAYAAAYGATNPPFGSFNGILQTDGETLSLVQPGTNATTDVLVAKVKYAAQPPWPTAATGPGAALQVLDPRQDNWRVGNWAAVQNNAFAPAQWVFVTTNIPATSSTLYIYLASPGDIYVDDVRLVRAGGTNLLANGDFESSLSGTWSLTANFTQSALNTIVRRSGNSSLHVVATAAGTGSGNAIFQNITPALTNGQTYSLSFWYLQSTSGGPLTVRLSSSTNPAIVNPAPPLMTNYSLATPGRTNSVFGSLTPFPSLWLNELQADNLAGITNSAGQRAPWVELYNPSTNTLSLNGLFLANNYSNLTQWAFPSAAVINPGQFKLIFADGQTNLSTLNEPHTSFSLTSGSGALALTRLSTNAQLQVLDFVNYAGLSPNHSYGSFPDGQSFDRQDFFFSSPGSTNNGSSAPLTVAINEWMAGNTHTIQDPLDDNKYDDWFELYNYGTNTVDPAGYYLTHDLTNKFEFQIPLGYAIPPHGFLLVWADKKTPTGSGDLHVNFRLSKSGTSIGLYGADGRPIDYVTFGAQVSDISMGRYPDGSGNIYTLPAATPRTANVGPNTAPVVTPPGDRFLYLGQTLSFTVQASDADLPPQALTYSLDPGAPTNASINSATGLFAWTPASTQTPSTNSFTVRVTDDGIPPLNGSQAFNVTVWDIPGLEVSNVNGSQLRLSWPSLPGKLYRVEYKDDLAATNWTTLPPDQTGTGSALSATVDISSAVQRFFRIQVQ